MIELCECGIMVANECKCKDDLSKIEVPQNYHNNVVKEFLNFEVKRLGLTPEEEVSADIAYKYAEGRIIADFKAYIDKTYTEHYKTDKDNLSSIECFDAWIALGDSTPTFRNTALKYLWRYGKKNGSNKADLMKTLHYTLMCLYVDHYRDLD